MASVVVNGHGQCYATVHLGQPLPSATERKLTLQGKFRIPLRKRVVLHHAVRVHSQAGFSRGTAKVKEEESQEEDVDSERAGGTRKLFNLPVTVKLQGSSQAKPKSRAKSNQVVFVAGATGKVGSRAVRELLKLGFQVRASTRNMERAQAMFKDALQIDPQPTNGGPFEIFSPAKLFGFLNPKPAKLLEIVECDLEDAESIEAALGNAGVVVCCIGASEKEVLDVTGPYRIDFKATQNLIDAASSTQVNHFVLLTSLGTQKFGFPAAVLNLFWGVLIWKAKAEEALIQSGLSYTIVRPGGMERPTDAYKETHNLRLDEADKLFGGQVSNLQVAELLASIVENPDVSMKKIVEAVAETTAPLRPIRELLEEIPANDSPVELPKTKKGQSGKGKEAAQKAFKKPAVIILDNRARQEEEKRIQAKNLVEEEKRIQAEKLAEEKRVQAEKDKEEKERLKAKALRKKYEEEIEAAREEEEAAKAAATAALAEKTELEKRVAEIRAKAEAAALAASQAKAVEAAVLAAARRGNVLSEEEKEKILEAVKLERLPKVDSLKETAESSKKKKKKMPVLPFLGMAAPSSTVPETLTKLPPEDEVKKEKVNGDKQAKLAAKAQEEAIAEKKRQEEEAKKKEKTKKLAEEDTARAVEVKRKEERDKLEKEAKALEEQEAAKAAAEAKKKEEEEEAKRKEEQEKADRLKAEAEENAKALAEQAAAAAAKAEEAKRKEEQDKLEKEAKALEEQETAKAAAEAKKKEEEEEAKRKEEQEKADRVKAEAEENAKALAEQEAAAAVKAEEAKRKEEQDKLEKEAKALEEQEAAKAAAEATKKEEEEEAKRKEEQEKADRLKAEAEENAKALAEQEAAAAAKAEEAKRKEEQDKLEKEAKALEEQEAAKAAAEAKKKEEEEEAKRKEEQEKADRLKAEAEENAKALAEQEAAAATKAEADKLATETAEKKEEGASKEAEAAPQPARQKGFWWFWQPTETDVPEEAQARKKEEEEEAKRKEEQEKADRLNAESEENAKALAEQEAAAAAKAEADKLATETAEQKEEGASKEAEAASQPARQKGFHWFWQPTETDVPEEAQARKKEEAKRKEEREKADRLKAEAEENAKALAEQEAVAAAKAEADKLATLTAIKKEEGASKEAEAAPQPARQKGFRWFWQPTETDVPEEVDTPVEAKAMELPRSSVPLSPYTRYPGLKPPSSPLPSPPIVSKTPEAGSSSSPLTSSSTDKEASNSKLTAVPEGVASWKQEDGQLTKTTEDAEERKKLIMEAIEREREAVQKAQAATSFLWPWQKKSSEPPLVTEPSAPTLEMQPKSEQTLPPAEQASAEETNPPPTSSRPLSPYSMYPGLKPPSPLISHLSKTESASLPKSDTLSPEINNMVQSQDKVEPLSEKGDENAVAEEQSKELEEDTEVRRLQVQETIAREREALEKAKAATTFMWPWQKAKVVKEEPVGPTTTEEGSAVVTKEEEPVFQPQEFATVETATLLTSSRPLSPYIQYPDLKPPGPPKPCPPPPPKSSVDKKQEAPEATAPLSPYTGFPDLKPPTSLGPSLKEEPENGAMPGEALEANEEVTGPAVANSGFKWPWQ